MSAEDGAIWSARGPTGPCLRVGPSSAPLLTSLPPFDLASDLPRLAAASAWVGLLLRNYIAASFAAEWCYMLYSTSFLRVSACINLQRLLLLFALRDPGGTPAHAQDTFAAPMATAVSQMEMSLQNRREHVDAVPPAEDDDNVLAASRLADSTVPDGGVGWLVIAAGKLSGTQLRAFRDATSGPEQLRTRFCPNTHIN